MSLDVERFAILFEGNPDCHGADHGEFVDHAPQWDWHLDGTEPIGIYPMWHDQVHWGCVDLDDPDLVPVYNLQSALTALGIHSVVELSRSKGYHVWVLLEADMWLRAFYMRRALLVACKIADASAREVNPKQETIPDGGVGNYVRLPYPWRGAGGRQVFGVVTVGHGPGENLRFLPLNFIDGLEYAESKVNHYTSILNASTLWTPPKPKLRHTSLDFHDVVERGLPHHVEERLKNLPLTRRMMETGDDCEDRSSALVHLGYLAQECEFNESETLAILIEADLRWGKYIVRDHNDRELRRIVERVFG